MPDNISLATPVVVLPDSLSTSFVESSNFPVISNSYHDTSIQRMLLVYSSDSQSYDPARARVMRRWSLAKRLGKSRTNGVDGTDGYQTLRDFWITTQGGLYSFFFYPKSSDYDPTGSNATGRATVVFSGGWRQTFGPRMTDVPLELVEVA